MKDEKVIYLKIWFVSIFIFPAIPIVIRLINNVHYGPIGFFTIFLLYFLYVLSEVISFSIYWLFFYALLLTVRNSSISRYLKNILIISASIILSLGTSFCALLLFGLMKTQNEYFVLVICNCICNIIGVLIFKTFSTKSKNKSVLRIVY